MPYLAAEASIVGRIAASRARSSALTAKLAFLRPAEVPSFVPMQDCSNGRDNPRKAKQGTQAWIEARRGRLTASSFAAALGFYGPGAQQKALTNRCTHARTDGSLWGEMHEQSALMTYLTSFLLPRCPDARLLETGFWPCELRSCQFVPPVSSGASPDGLVEANALVGSGGAILEVKCPYNSGKPKAWPRLSARLMPQLQGTLQATGRDICHVITWAPSGAFVFEVQKDAAYQRSMASALARAVSAAQQGRPFTAEESDQVADVRARSRTMADASVCLQHVETQNCVRAPVSTRSWPDETSCNSIWDSASS